MKIAGSFLLKDTSKEQIINDGEAVLVLIYGGSPNENLNNLRFKKFSQKVSKSLKSVQVSWVFNYLSISNFFLHFKSNLM